MVKSLSFCRGRLACQEEDELWQLSLRKSTAKLHYPVGADAFGFHLDLDIVKDRL